MAAIFEKDPDAVLDYEFDWSDWLPSGDTIASAVVEAETGIVIDSQANTSTAVTVWLSGGTANTGYEVTCHITTAEARQDDRTITIHVIEK
jgi:hypothetical protein